MTIKKAVPRPALALAALLVLVAAQLAGASHPRPKAASPVKVSVVPAYEECTAPNRTHGPPLAFPSCSPPVPASGYLTVGTPDANGAPANSVGSVRLRVIVGQPGPPDDSDVQISTAITDVRCKTGVSACGNANATDGPDYTGELAGNATIRITDHNNAADPGGGTDPATVVDIPLPFTVSCVNTSDTSIGGFCGIPPPPCLGCFSRLEGHRTVVEITQIRIFDGGPDGVAATENNTLFAVQGIFIP
ncbi:MAG: hypothetical protein ACRDLQ_10755 [Solirubrobacterales bacterium]